MHKAQNPLTRSDQRTTNEDTNQLLPLTEKLLFFSLHFPDN
jgi:hypothetical protein